MVFRKKVSFLGIIVGAIVDVVGSNVWGLLAIVYVIISYKLMSLPPTQMMSSVMQIFKTDPLMFTANLIVGGFFSILGGYTAALIAKHDELLNGTFASFLCVAIGIYAIGTGNFTGPLIVALLSLLIDPLLGLFGGFLRLKQRSRTRKVFSEAINISI